MSYTFGVINNPIRANGFTHSGVFHADDVFSTAFLSQYYNTALNLPFYVMRVPSWPFKDMKYTTSAIIYDIGMDQFDHHGERVARDNGVPYAAFGKLWKEYGLQYICKKYPELNYTDAMWVANKFDSIFIQGIDAVDNGEMPQADYPVQAMTISTLIADMNPAWNDHGPFAEDTKFHDAVTFASGVMKVVLERLISTASARHIVRKAIDNSINKGTVIVLDEFCPWQEELLNGTHPHAKYVLYLLYPSKRNSGYWKWQVVPTAVGSFEQRCHVPTEWCGKAGDELYLASGFDDAVFVHKSGFLGECKTFEEAKLMVGSAIVEAIKRGELIDLDSSDPNARIVRASDIAE